MRIRSQFLRAVAIAGALPAVADACGAADVQAAEISAGTPAGSQSGWAFTFTAYSWLSWLSGDLTVKGRTFRVAASPTDLIEALDWSGVPMWMSYAEARNGKLGLFNDVVYSKLAGSGRFAASRPGGVATLNGQVEADNTQATIELGAAYEVWSSGSPGLGTSAALDVLGGARYWYQSIGVSAAFDLNGLPGPGIIIDGDRVIARSGSVDWLDPFVGARLRYELGPGQDLVVRGDIGGFGAGSDLSWQAIVTSNWQLSRTATHSVDAYIGYKALSVDYAQGSGTTRYEYDVLQHGPVAGLTVRY